MESTEEMRLRAIEKLDDLADRLAADRRFDDAKTVVWGMGLIKEMMPKYDPQIARDAEALREIADKQPVSGDADWHHSCLLNRVADRIEKMNGPKPKPDLGHMRQELVCAANRIDTKDEVNRAKLETAIKALKGEADVAH